MPESIRDYFVKLDSGQARVAITPLELDDVSLFLSEIAEEERAERSRIAEEERKKADEARQREDEAREQKLLQRRAAAASRTVQATPGMSRQGPGSATTETSQVMRAREESLESVYLGKEVDLQQLIASLGKRLPESEIRSQVRTVGNYYVDSTVLKANGVAIVGASGSGRSMSLRRILDGIATRQSVRVITVDPKGEHRGIAWKHKWQVFAFASDAQARQLRIPFFSQQDDDSELIADLVQEWCLSSGVGCSDQQRARIASIVKSEREKKLLSAEILPGALSKEVDLVQISTKIGRNFLARNLLQRLFVSTSQGGAGGSLASELEGFDGKQSVLFDLSGRGLRDPTTKEERLIATVLILRELASAGISDCVIVLEDFLDRFKSDSLRRKVLDLASLLRGRNNSIVATARSQIRSFLGKDCLELLHRLSGEKIVNDELAEFKMDQDIRNLQNLITFLPRGYALSSSVRTDTVVVRSGAFKIEPLQFS